MKNDIFKSSKLRKSKKGFNNIIILAGISAILLLSAFMIDTTNNAFSTGGSSFNTQNLKDNLQSDSESVNTITIGSILTTFLKLIFWDVSGSLNLPVWLELFYTLLFIVSILTVYAMIRSGA